MKKKKKTTGQIMCIICYVILVISAVLAYYYGHKPNETELREFTQSISEACFSSHDAEGRILCLMGGISNDLCTIIHSTMKSWAFGTMWTLFRWICGQFAVMALMFIIIYHITLLPNTLLKNNIKLETLAFRGLICGAICPVVAYFDLSAKINYILIWFIVAIIGTTCISLFFKAPSLKGFNFLRVFLGAIIGSVFYFIIGSLMFPIALMGFLASWLLIGCYGAIEDEGTNKRTANSREYHNGSYSESNSSIYTSYSSSDYSSSDYSNSSSEKSSFPGLNLGGYNSPDVGGGSYNDKYGYNSSDYAYGGSYNSNTGYTGPDVGGYGYYNSTYGYSSYDSAYGGSYNSEYGYSSSDSYGGSYNDSE